MYSSHVHSFEVHVMRPSSHSESHGSTVHNLFVVQPTKHYRYVNIIQCKVYTAPSVLSIFIVKGSR